MKAAGLLTVLLTAGCGWPAAAALHKGAGSGPARPAQGAIEALALRADELRIESLGSAAMPDVYGVVAGPAVGLLRRNRLRVQLLQQHFEIAVDSRSVAHWATAWDEATVVVATSGRQRLVSSGAASAWDDFADQWQYTVRWSGGWHVWSAVDLPPDQWWPA